jgi:uncharacterized protein (TIGR04222 family)
MPVSTSGILDAAETVSVGLVAGHGRAVDQRVLVRLTPFHPLLLHQSGVPPRSETQPWWVRSSGWCGMVNRIDPGADHGECRMAIYLIVVLALLLASFVVRRSMLGGSVLFEPLSLTPYVAAYLTGRHERVALTVLSDMVGEGLLHVDGNGRSIVPRDAPINPLWQSVLRGFRGKHQVKVIDLYRRAVREPGIRSFHDESVRLGVLYQPRHRRKIMVVPMAVAVLAVAGIPLTLIEVLSKARAAELILALVVVAIVGIGLSATTPRVTPIGRQALRFIARALSASDRDGSLAVDGQSYRLASYAVATRGVFAIKASSLGQALASG